MCKLLEVPDEIYDQKNYQYYTRDRWNCLKINLSKLMNNQVDSLKLNEEILNCIYHQSDNEGRLSWSVIDYQKSIQSVYTVFGNLVIFCQNYDSMNPEKKVLDKDTILCNHFAHLFQILQIEIKVMAVNCFQEPKTKRMIIDLPIECLDLMLGIIQIVYDNKITDKTLLTLNFTEFNKICEIQITYFIESPQKEILLIKILDFFPKIMHSETINISKPNDLQALEQFTDFLMQLLKKTDSQYTIAKVLNCIYDIFCDEELDKVFIRKNVYKTLKVKF